MNLRLPLACAAAILVPVAPASADGAWGGDPPLLACPGRQAMGDRTMKVYATDLLGVQSMRYYLHATWCYRPATGRVTNAAANAWGQTVTPGSMTPGANVEGPTVTGLGSPVVRIHARGSFAYHWPAPSLRMANLYPWIGLTLLGGQNYSCTAGMSSDGPLRPRLNVSRCVRATEAVR